MEGLQSMVTEALTGIVIALVGLLAGYATYGIKKMTEKVKVQVSTLKTEEERKLYYSALEDFELFTGVAVQSLEQTTAGTLRELVKDGKADWDELKQLSDLAAKEIMSNLSPEAKKVLEKNIINFEAYLKNAIEAKVREIKLLK